MTKEIPLKIMVDVSDPRWLLICGVHGSIHLDELQSIEAQIREDFPHLGIADPLPPDVCAVEFDVAFVDSERDEMGRTTVPSYWEFTPTGKVEKYKE